MQIRETEENEETILTEIRRTLFALQDEKYREFQTKLIPNVDPERIIGVRTPALRQYAKELAKQQETIVFLWDLPHRYFDENQLHAFLLGEIKDFSLCLNAVRRFLPYVDNWATCDQLSPKVFRKNRPELLTAVTEWLCSDHTYTLRFAIGMLMEHFLDGDFDPAYPETVAAVRSEEYYVNMMIAWYFATALAKQYRAVLPYLENRRLDPRTHNKAIQKALESYRISPAQKETLRGLKVK
ncbi:MAG: DNA alkylation repair protein [Lachnospiraceae bacterium]|nr:DNA alkylation repair protein [Lachnospiraceae bacterium]